MALAYFNVKGKYQAFIGQALSDTTAVAKYVNGTVVFCPMVVKGGTLNANDAARLALQPVQAVIKQIADPNYGEITTAAFPKIAGCALVANVGFGLTVPLLYTVKFVDMRAADGSPIDIREFSFEAPTSDGGQVDLVVEASKPSAYALPSSISSVDGGTP